MAKLIDKDTILAEINRLIAELVEKGEGTMFEQGRISAFEDAKLFLDSLEVKEVDLEEEIEKQFDFHKNSGDNSLVKGFVVMNKGGFEYSAKHFFELGMAVSNKAQKGE